MDCKLVYYASVHQVMDRREKDSKIFQYLIFDKLSICTFTSSNGQCVYPKAFIKKVC